jgi:superoxide dismutase, Fe-Mn family
MWSMLYVITIINKVCEDKMDQEKYPFNLPNLNYQLDALEPHISKNTLEYHYGNLNGLIKDTDMAQLSLAEIIKQSAYDVSKTSIFNNAAQTWNHSFYWNCIAPEGGGLPKEDLLNCIKRDFDNYSKFIAEFNKAALSQFGSGWAWLVWDKDQQRLLITKTGNADLPMIHNQEALLTIDVWEHAYYLDHQNRRAEYIKVFMEHLVNWDFAVNNFSRRTLK